MNETLNVESAPAVAVQRVVRCFCVPAPAGRFNLGSDVIGYGIAEDGETLASHYSSNESFSQHDMGLTSEWKHDEYKRRYPEGFRVEWVNTPPPDWDALREAPNMNYNEGNSDNTNEKG
ncbi:hypothetical protein UFOVP672_37 [uncultured Caudovirales phage]|uniref:Uncharacterized protein n=1 Tax=uncultured Caudovirales phage TaxID=2100421 RepID=A0A6J5NAP7_9CAUD|nr:hypothetical protein UFOVP672_37 [uncultured Caudovirales phage]